MLIRASFIVKGRTPEAIKVAQNHAGIVSLFAEDGMAEAHEAHPGVVTEQTSVKEAASAPEGCAMKGAGCCGKEGGCRGKAVSKEPEDAGRRSGEGAANY